jgi:hypothetical protein
MEITIPRVELQQRRLFFATPMYGGQCAGMFCKSTNDLSAKSRELGVQLRYYYIFNESLITRARNYCTDEFLRSDCTHLIFVDSDIGFEADAVFTLLSLQSDASDYDVICGPYPKKTIAWEKIKAAVDAGYADKNPNILDEFVGDYVFNPAAGKTSFRLDEPAEVLESGTGFMMIRRKTLEKLAELHPEWSYRPDHVRSAQFDGSREITAFFHDPIDPVTKRWLSEDYFFCQEVRKAGMKVWLAPWLRLQHVGTHIYGGSLAALAQIGAAATADVGKIGEKK